MSNRGGSNGSGHGHVTSSDMGHGPFSNNPIFNNDPTGGRYDITDLEGHVVHKFDPKKDSNNPNYNAMLTQNRMQVILQEKMAIMRQQDDTMAMAEQLSAMRQAREEKQMLAQRHDHDYETPYGHVAVKYDKAETAAQLNGLATTGAGSSDRDTATISSTTTTPTGDAVATATMHRGHFTDEKGNHEAIFVADADGKWKAFVEGAHVDLTNKTIAVTMDKGDKFAGKTFDVSVTPDSHLGNVALNNTPTDASRQQGQGAALT